MADPQPAVVDVGNVLSSLRSLPDFRGEGEPDTVVSNWKMYKDKYRSYMDILGIEDQQLWYKVIKSKLDGKAAQLFFAQHAKAAIENWEQLDNLFSKQLLSDLDDDFAKRAPWLESSGWVTSGKDVKSMLERLDNETNTAPNPPSDVEKICLALNALHPEARALVRSDAAGAFPTVFAAWAPYAHAKLAAFEPRSSSSSAQHRGQYQQPERALPEHTVPGYETVRCRSCKRLGHPGPLAKRGDRFVCPDYRSDYNKRSADGQNGHGSNHGNGNNKQPRTQ
jgi:hypothetical protein